MTRHALASNGPKMDLGVPTGWVRELLTTPPSHARMREATQAYFYPASQPPAHASRSSHAHSSPFTPPTRHLLTTFTHIHMYTHTHIQHTPFLLHTLLTSDHVLLGTDLPSHSRSSFWYTVQPSGSGSDIPSLLQHDASVMIGFGSQWLSIGQAFCHSENTVGFWFLVLFCFA